MSEQPNNPLHGLTLETILTQLQEKFGWDGLYARVRVNCFSSQPSIKSSLTFLRKTPWAREKIEALYIRTFASGTKPHQKTARHPLSGADTARSTPSKPNTKPFEKDKKKDKKKASKAPLLTCGQ